MRIYLVLPVQKDRAKCKEFLEEFRPPILRNKNDVADPKYLMLVNQVRNRQAIRIDIELDDVALYQGTGEEFVQSIVSNTRRYVELFSSVIDELLGPAEAVPEALADNEDVVMSHRIRQAQAYAERQTGNNEVTAQDISRLYSPRMTRKYEVHIIPRSTEKALAVRDIKAADLGKLVNIRAIVLRASDVRPLVQVASYAW
jgi:DNA replication licensing factor MCM7